MPFTVAVYMVRAFLGGGGDEATIGRMTGLLASVYSFSQFTTSYAWGIFSSRFGRKVSNRVHCGPLAASVEKGPRPKADVCLIGRVLKGSLRMVPRQRRKACISNHAPWVYASACPHSSCIAAYA